MLVGGRAEGVVMRLDSPLSFWGGISPATSEVVLAGHPECGDRTAGRILVVPRPIGSRTGEGVATSLIFSSTTHGTLP